ncbi:MAG: hypothetical protein R2860_05655 [Desulfobacterales bacterium]
MASAPLYPRHTPPEHTTDCCLPHCVRSLRRKDEYAEALGMQMELLNNQITREQGVPPRQSYWSFGLYLLAANIRVPTTVLDFPAWRNFTEELKKEGYTHVVLPLLCQMSTK